MRQTTKDASSSSRQLDSLNVENIEKAGYDHGFKRRISPSPRPRPVVDFKISLGLPSLKTGISCFAICIYLFMMHNENTIWYGHFL